jgi:hypothetical protein
MPSKGFSLKFTRRSMETGLLADPCWIDTGEHRKAFKGPSKCQSATGVIKTSGATLPDTASNAAEKTSFAPTTESAA